MQTPTVARSPLSARVASEIRAEMGRRGILQSTLAEKLGENGAWVSRRIAVLPSISMSLSDLDRIAAALDTDAGALIARATPSVAA